MIEKLCNIVITAHVDHSKTTPIDKLLQQFGMFDSRTRTQERTTNSNDLEKERGITILAKGTAIEWNDYHINIVNTLGHTDFGGEVEHAMSMVDSVLLVVDALDGPMPQTRFVTEKMFAYGLRPITVINKVDRPDAHPDWVVDQVFDLFVNLDVIDEQLDFPIVYAPALDDIADLDHENVTGGVTPLYQVIVGHVSAPNANLGGSSWIRISQLDYNSYVDTIGIGHIKHSKVRPNQQVTIADSGGKIHNAKVDEVLGRLDLKRVETNLTGAGDIVVITGLGELSISDTVYDTQSVEVLPTLSVDEPTASVFFCVGISPPCGKEGESVTSCQIPDRLSKELVYNVALCAEETKGTNVFRVSGRSGLHLSVLVKNMHREGSELAVSRPKVIFRGIDGREQEPYKSVTLDIKGQHQGSVIRALGERKDDLKNMNPDDKNRIHLDCVIPNRGLVGSRSEFVTIVSGISLLYSTFSRYDDVHPGEVGQCQNGILVSNGQDKTITFTLFGLQDCGKLFLGHDAEVYGGQIIGIHSRSSDLTINYLTGRELTNMRASGTDGVVVLVPPIRMTLEQALELIDDDELVEVALTSIRICKRHLTENDRRRANRTPKDSQFRFLVIEKSASDGRLFFAYRKRTPI